MKKSICFAWYANNKFIGWWGGTFGTVSKSPKLYTNTEEQLKVIQSNLTHKLSKINTSSFDIEKTKVKGLGALGLASFDGEELLRGKEVELKIVECPEYDGKDPDWDEEAYDKLKDEYDEAFQEASKHLGDFPSLTRTKFVTEYYKEHPRPECKNWIYADYNKVKEWAKNEPIEFIGVIKPNYANS